MGSSSGSCRGCWLGMPCGANVTRAVEVAERAMMQSRNESGEASMVWYGAASNLNVLYAV